MLFRSNDTATTEIYTLLYTLSLHDALPICIEEQAVRLERQPVESRAGYGDADRIGSVEHAVEQMTAADQGHGAGRGRDRFAADRALEAAGPVELDDVVVGTGLDASAVPLEPLGREPRAMRYEVVDRVRNVAAERQRGGWRGRTNRVHRRKEGAPSLEGFPGWQARGRQEEVRQTRLSRRVVCTQGARPIAIRPVRRKMLSIRPLVGQPKCACVLRGGRKCRKQGG